MQPSRSTMAVEPVMSSYPSPARGFGCTLPHARSGRPIPCSPNNAAAPLQVSAPPAFPFFYFAAHDKGIASSSEGAFRRRRSILCRWDLAGDDPSRGRHDPRLWPVCPVGCWRSAGDRPRTPVVSSNAAMIPGHSTDVGASTVVDPGGRRYACLGDRSIARPCSARHATSLFPGRPNCDASQPT